MRQASRVTAAVVGGLALLCTPVLVAAQTAPDFRPVTHLASIAPGSILGVVQDEHGAPVAGAMVSALGATTAFAVSDRAGRFELRTLSPGPYVVRAHLSGFVASRAQVVDVRPSARVSSAIALRHVSNPAGEGKVPVLAAGFGAAPDPPAAADAPAASPTPAVATPDDDHGEIAWRLRHARRGVLKDATLPAEMLAAHTPEEHRGLGAPSIFERAESSARFASNLFAGTPFVGQVNLLTTGSFDTPQQLFTADFSHNTTFMSLGAPVGEHADWTARAALTQGDLSSWMVAGEYTTRAGARHRYDIGLSYSTQRYDGGNVATLRDVTDGSRNAGEIYAFDTFAVSPAVAITYGTRYARYDYLDRASLLSPRLALTLTPAPHFRINASLSSRATAPGAEEFTPRLDAGVFLPPQRTFSSLESGRPFESERTNHAEVEIERDLPLATVSVRAFRQHVEDQIVTLFGVNLAGAPSSIGNYFLTNLGDVDAAGITAGVRAAIANRVHGSVEYSLTQARMPQIDGDNLAYLLVFAPSAIRPSAERIHDVATSIETEVPETSTRVVVLYRVSTAFAHAPASVAATTPSLDTRFDVQVRQALPFLDFSSAKWEALFAVRNFFRDTAVDQSVYDELLVVRPPKRVVGGLTLKF
jgi:TonB-dependent receptor-like protein/carboxypeptidase family protein